MAVVLHFTAAGFLLALLHECGVAPIRAFFIVFVFALHPLRAESVAWVSERKDVLCVFWLMVCCWSHARWARTRRPVYFAASLIACLLAMLSKPLAVVAPLLLLLLDWWPLRRKLSVQRLLLEKSAHILIAFTGLLIGLFYKAGSLHSGLTGDTLQITGINKAWVAGHAVWIHAFNHFWPVSLAFFHPVDLERLWLGGSLGLTFLGVLLTFAYWQRNRRPWVTMGILWYLVALTPSSGIVQISHFAYADRYSYLPSIGLLIAFVMSIKLPTDNTARHAAMAGIGLGLVLMLFLATWQVSHWRNSEALFQRALAVNPKNHVAHMKLSEVYLSRGALDRSEHHANAAGAAFEGRAYQASQYELLGKIAFARRDYNHAKSLWHEGLGFLPNDQGLHCNLGTLALEERDNPTALFHFEKCRQGRIVSSGLWNNYGVALERAGRGAEAELAYRKAIEIDANNIGPLINLAKRLEQRGIRNEAHAMFSHALALVPNHPQAVAGAARTR